MKTPGAGMRLGCKPAPVTLLGAARLTLPLRGVDSLSLARARLQGRIQSPSTVSQRRSVSPAALRRSPGRFLALLQPRSLLHRPSPPRPLLQPQLGCDRGRRVPEGFVPVLQGQVGFSPAGNADAGARRAEAEAGLGCCPLPGEAQAMGIITLA